MVLVKPRAIGDGFALPTKNAFEFPALGFIVEDGWEVASEWNAIGFFHSALFEELVQERGTYFVNDAFAPMMLVEMTRLKLAVAWALLTSTA